jgi:hypothetical protein
MSLAIKSGLRNQTLVKETIVTPTAVTTTGIRGDLEVGTEETTEGTTGGRVTGTTGITKVGTGSEKDPAAVSTVNRKAILPRTVLNPNRSSIETPENHSLVSSVEKKDIRSSTVPKRIYSRTFY